jgi:hypothetical protein
VPVAGVAVLLTGWALATPVLPTGWPVAVAAAAGWSLAVVAWLRHREWPAAPAHLAAWAAPAALLAPLSALGWLSADGLILWGPISAVLAVALAAAHDPALLRPTPVSGRLGQSPSASARLGMPVAACMVSPMRSAAPRAAHKFRDDGGTETPVTATMPLSVPACAELRSRKGTAKRAAGSSRSGRLPTRVS